MKVALVQMKVLPGQIDKNIEYMKMKIEENMEADFIVFPEMAVSGYLLGDLWMDKHFLKKIYKANHELIFFIRSKSYSGVVIFGSANVNAENKESKPYNSAFIASKDRTIIYNKKLMPNYRIFDDERYFKSGRDNNVSLYKMNGFNFAVQICEDMWEDDNMYSTYSPTLRSTRDGAEYIFNISASPYSKNKSKARDKNIKNLLTRNNNWFDTNGLKTNRLKNFFYVNCVGSQNNGKNIVVFDGDSGIFNSKGDQIFQEEKSTLFDEMTVIFDESSKSFVSTDYKSKDESEYYEENYNMFKSISIGIREMDQIYGSPIPYVIGVSGGIDSAVVLALLKEAVGVDRIIAINLPTKYNSETTKDAAQKLCDNLGIKLHTIPIGKLVKKNRKLLKDFTHIDLPDVVDENIQAKIRGTSILSNLASIHGGVMTNNGNKVEVALGYATLYGDVNGSIAPIGDLTKVEVWKLAKFINYHKEIIPKELIMDFSSVAKYDENLKKIEPSAELKHKQVDPMKWGYHDAILSYLMKWNKGSFKELISFWDNKTILSELTKYSDIDTDVLERVMTRYDILNNRENFIKDLKWFSSKFQGNVFKRLQAPPIVIQSRSSFGYDYRESMLNIDRMEF